MPGTGTSNIGRSVLGAAGRIAGGILGAAAHVVLPAVGGKPDPRLLERSPRFHDGRFRNAPQPPRPPLPNDEPFTVRDFLSGGAARRPPGRIPLVPQAADRPVDGLHITWYGHASTLVEIEGRRLLLDPVWGERPSPVQFVGPRRMHPAPHRLEELPRLDAIVISHDHYDHLDRDAVRLLLRDQQAPFVTALGVGAHLRRWGVPESRIVELDWSESTEIAGVRITAAPGQHFSGRLFTRNNTLWASWVLAGPSRSVFYTGDSGYFDGYAAIGEQYGPFDATLVQIGAYNASWPDIHMTPEEGVATHRDVRGGVLIPVHWGTFNLALHPWGEPADRVWREAKAHEVVLAVPRPGERIDVDQPPAVDGWWQYLA
ncbi:MBL fold metallo-hydrolase [Amycolatopsis antarctica]